MYKTAKPLSMPLGPVMVDVAALSLDDEDRKRLLNPSVGAVILFARNYQNRSQVSSLITEITSLRSPSLLIAVDQEGGRVQRFQEGFTILPAATTFGELWQADHELAMTSAYDSAVTMASELIEVGVDFSFAPVFDVTSKESEVIGDRCFHQDPKIATKLLSSYIKGMHSVGMVAIAKHFPGHGGVSGDSHHFLPTDCRQLQEVEDNDIKPYRHLVNQIQGVMTAHVLFENCDTEIPTYSSYWLKKVLRDELGFKGVIFSDDLAMQGAIDAEQGGIVASAEKAIAAGCDMVLICNKPDVADELLAGLKFEPNQELSNKLSCLQINRQL